MYRITFENNAGELDARNVETEDRICAAVIELLENGDYPMQAGDVIRVTEIKKGTR